MKHPKAPADVPAYPLMWPMGKKRTLNIARVNNANWGRPTWTQAVADLRAELDRSKIHDYQLSTGRQPGTGREDDPGAALWFMEHDGTGWRLARLASDRYKTVALNVKAIALTLTRLRQVADYGVYTATEARQGAIYEALPPPDAPPPDWWIVLKISPDSPREIVDAAYKALARKAHPDTGGSDAAFKELTDAYQRAKLALA